MIRLIKHKQNEKIVANNSYEKFIFNDNRILIKTIFPNDEQHYMALDLGAGTTVLLQNSGLNYIEAQKSVLSFGKIQSADNKIQKAEYYTIGSLFTNSFKIDNSFLPLLPDFQTSPCDKFVGVWGADAFDKKILVIKMHDSTLAVFDKLPSLDEWIPVESEYKFPHFYVVLIIGDQKIKLLFDTGSSSGIVLSEDYYNQKLKDQPQLLKEKNKWYGQAFNTASGLSGVDTTTTAKVIKSSWGSYVLDTVPLTISKKIKSNVLGMEALKRFNILLDYSNEKIYIQRNTNYHYTTKGGFFKQQGFNYRYINGKIIAINVIRADSPAAKAGLQVKDEIISVNGILLAEMDACKIDATLNSLVLNKSISMVVKRGNQTLTITLTSP